MVSINISFCEESVLLPEVEAANGTAVPIFIDTETSRLGVPFVRVQLDSSCRSLQERRARFDLARIAESIETTTFVHVGQDLKDLLHDFIGA